MQSRASSWDWVPGRGPAPSWTERRVGAHHQNYGGVLMNKLVAADRCDFNGCLQCLKPKE